MSKIKLYDLTESQNGYKVRLTLSHLKLEYEFIRLNLLEGEHRKPEFLKLNPNGQIPTLVDDGFPIWESNAIILYLARKYKPNNLIPEDAKKLGMMLEWIFFESCKLQPNLQLARYLTTIQPKFFPDQKVDELKLKEYRNNSSKHLKVLDEHLSSHEYLADEYSLADISCYAQIYPSNECGIDISKYPNIQKWQKKVESQPGYIDMRAKIAVTN